MFQQRICHIYIYIPCQLSTLCSKSNNYLFYSFIYLLEKCRETLFDIFSQEEDLQYLTKSANPSMTGIMKSNTGCIDPSRGAN